jgi:hypothetical protein
MAARIMASLISVRVSWSFPSRRYATSQANVRSMVLIANDKFCVTRHLRMGRASRPAR